MESVIYPYTNVDSMEQREAMSEKEKQKAMLTLLNSHAHYVIPYLKLLPDVCMNINQRLKDGEKPL